MNNHFSKARKSKIELSEGALYPSQILNKQFYGTLVRSDNINKHPVTVINKHKKGYFKFCPCYAVHS